MKVLDLNGCIKQQDLANSDIKIKESQVEILNMLEEFSLRVIHSKTINHSALNSVKPAFIGISELNTVVMLNERDITFGNNIYSAILEVYKNWKVGIDKRFMK